MVQKHYSLCPADFDAPGPERDVLDAYMTTRLKYVVGMGWLHDIRSDVDVYDELDTTRYFVRLSGAADDRGDDVTAGLRLTRVPSLSESLTWTMLNKVPDVGRILDRARERQADGIVQHALSGECDLWDVTRLVAPMDGTVPAVAVINSIYELFGMALYETVIQPQADPAWIFLTTASIKRLFDMIGVEYTVMFSGHVSPSDDYDSFLCVTRPKSAFSAMRHSANLTHRRAFKSVAAGCDAAQRCQLQMTGT